MLVGALLAGAVLAPLAFFFKSYLGVYDLVAGVIAGAIVGFILKACIPKGFPIPKNIITFTCIGMSTFCFWVIIDGIITGEIHDLPRRRAGVGKGFARMWSWKSDPIDFSFLVFMWTLGGALCVGIPLWYYLRSDPRNFTGRLFAQFHKASNHFCRMGEIIKKHAGNRRVYNRCIVNISTFLFACSAEIVKQA